MHGKRGLMRPVWIFALTGAAVAAPAFAQTVSVPSDPWSRYQALDVTRKPNGRVEILTRRDGPSGTSFALREVDCRTSRFRYLGEGDTREEAMEATNQDKLGPLTEGSISWHIARFACRSSMR